MRARTSVTREAPMPPRRDWYASCGCIRERLGYRKGLGVLTAVRATPPYL